MHDDVKLQDHMQNAAVFVHLIIQASHAFSDNSVSCCMRPADQSAQTQHVWGAMLES